MLAALSGESEAVRLLIEAGAPIGAWDRVSKRFFIRVVWEVKSIVLFSYNILSQYIGYDDVIILNNFIIDVCF